MPDTRYPGKMPRVRMWRHPTTYPSTDLVSAPYPGTYPRSQITRATAETIDLDATAETIDFGVK
eukprot:scaffold142718_cov64-Cyclotella_meneghiniana.AAC.1